MRTYHSTCLWLLRVGLLLLTSLVHISAIAQSVDQNIQTIRNILKTPEGMLDLARAKLTIDQMIDPSIDIDVNLKTLNAMAAAVSLSAGQNAGSLQTASVLRSYLYDEGAWNNRQPFRYDFDGDPLGRKVSNKLLPNYLATKKGNCISMPILFVLLAQKLGLDATLAQTPNHVFVKYRDETGRIYNLETTSGGNPRRDELYQRDTPMTTEALKNGLYMRPLNKKESMLVVMVGTLVDHYKDAQKPAAIIALSELVLEHFPKDHNAMLNKGYAYYVLLNHEFLQKYPNPRDIPVKLHARYSELDRNNRMWYEKAEALGWREPDPEADARYMKFVKNAKAN